MPWLAGGAAQARERVAHRRLGDAQRLGGARHLALAQQGMQHAQQVEVQVVELHGSRNIHGGDAEDHASWLG
jgi:hypothetical protein